MKNFVAFAATLALHIGAVAYFQYNAEQAIPTPNGEVIVKELGFGPVRALAYVPEGQVRQAAL